MDKAFKEAITAIRSAGHEVSDKAESGWRPAVNKLNELFRSHAVNDKSQSQAFLSSRSQ